MWTVVVGLAALGWAAIIGAAVLTALRLPRLRDVDPSLSPDTGWPSVSIVVAARDEEEGVEHAARSLLAIDYPRLEVVAVDDRSCDRTGGILDRLAAADPRLRALHVAELPAGWLGKCHACHVGAAAASGEWLLFTDGDVVFTPDVLRRSLAFACAHRLDHVVAFPHLVAPGFLERAFVSTFGLFLVPVLQAWTLRRPRSRGFVGAGAFNLVRREAYTACGGHARIRFEIVDDVKLGLLLRRSGARQAAILGDGAVRVRWNRGFRGSWRGLLKNSFAGAEWSWLTVLAAALATAVLAWGPLLGALLAPTPGLRLLAGATALVSAGVLSGAAFRVSGGNLLEGLLAPVSVTALGAVLVASAALATLRGGIVWRGTRYPLADLRAACLRDRDVPVDRAVGW